MVALKNIFLLSVSLLFLMFIQSCGGGEEPSNGDSELVVSFSEATTQASENSTTLNVPLNIEGSADDNVFITYEVDASSTASFPLDVQPLTSTTFVIPPGATAYNMEFVVLEDNTLELEEESLILNLISASEGGSIGSQSTHTIQISADDVTVVSFNSDETSDTFGNDFSTIVTLSKAYPEDVEVEIDLDVDSDPAGNYYYNVQEVGGVFVGVENEFVTIPAGDTEASFSLSFNPSYGESSFEGTVATFEIVDIERADEISASDLVLNPDETKLLHDVVLSGTTASTGSLLVEMSWVSTNNDVDLDMYLLDDSNDQILSSTFAEFDGTESFEITNEEADGEYVLVISWFEGTGSADIEIVITPQNGATWLGSTDPETATYDAITEADIDEANVFATITKDGDSYE